jgi:hypothetical protein
VRFVSADETRRAIARLKVEQALLQAETGALHSEPRPDQPAGRRRRSGGSPPPAADVARVEAWCDARVARHRRNQIRIVCEQRGRSVTIVEERPLFSGVPGIDWSRIRVAQLRWDASGQEWELYCADRNGRWWPYDERDRSATIEPLLSELERDPTGIFWG